MNPLSPQLPESVQDFNFDLPGFLSTPSQSILWGALGVMAIILVGVTLVLYYHWLRYGLGDRMVIFAQVLYTVVLLLAFIVMFGAATSYA